MRVSRVSCVCHQTSGVDLVVKVVNIPDSDTAVELYLHDTAGSDLYASMRPALVCAALFRIQMCGGGSQVKPPPCIVCVCVYVRVLCVCACVCACVVCECVFLCAFASVSIVPQWSGAALVLVAYDMTNLQSFHHCSKWIESIMESFGHRKIRGTNVPVLAHEPHPRVPTTHEQSCRVCVVRAPTLQVCWLAVKAICVTRLWSRRTWLGNWRLSMACIISSALRLRARKLTRPLITWPVCSIAATRPL
jgi:hypothetical protein